jgi:hypothetical protein
LKYNKCFGKDYFVKIWKEIPDKVDESGWILGRTEKDGIGKV